SGSDKELEEEPEEVLPLCSRADCELGELGCAVESDSPSGMFCVEEFCCWLACVDCDPLNACWPFSASCSIWRCNRSALRCSIFCSHRCWKDCCGFCCWLARSCCCLANASSFARVSSMFFSWDSAGVVLCVVSYWFLAVSSSRSK